MEFPSTNLSNLYFEPIYFFGVCNILQQRDLQLNLALFVYFQYATLLWKRQKWDDFTGVSEMAPQDRTPAHTHLVPEWKNTNVSPKALHILPSEMSPISQPLKY